MTVEEKIRELHFLQGEIERLQIGVGPAAYNMIVRARQAGGVLRMDEDPTYDGIIPRAMNWKNVARLVRKAGRGVLSNRDTTLTLTED